MIHRITLTIDDTKNPSNRWWFGSYITLFLRLKKYNVQHRNYVNYHSFLIFNGRNWDHEVRNSRTNYKLIKHLHKEKQHYENLSKCNLHQFHIMGVNSSIWIMMKLSNIELRGTKIYYLDNKSGQYVDHINAKRQLIKNLNEEKKRCFTRINKA